MGIDLLLFLLLFMAVVGGPILGPIVGGAVVQSYLGWRWTEYVCRMAVLVGRCMC